jgi:hypothetical protein
MDQEGIVTLHCLSISLIGIPLQLPLASPTVILRVVRGPLRPQGHRKNRMSQACISTIGTWLKNVCSDLRHDPGPLVLLTRYEDDNKDFQTLLPHISTYSATHQLLEALRTSDGRPLPQRIINGLPNIQIVNGKPSTSMDEWAALQFRIGIYMHYMVKRMPDGRLRLLAQSRRGAGGKDCFTFVQGERKNASELGVRRRINTHMTESRGYLNGMRPIPSTDHGFRQLAPDRLQQF